MGLDKSRSHIHQRPTQSIACYSLISTEARARTYTPAQIETQSQGENEKDGGRVDGGRKIQLEREGHESKRIRKAKKIASRK